jgi:Trk K+ transport system NAD-binding subunit
MGLLFVGLVLLWVVAASPWVDRLITTLVDRALRRYGRLDVRDYANLIHLAEDYRLVELLVEPNDWLAGRTLGEAKLRDEGIVVLGIERASGAYLGVPKGEARVEADDTLILYGRETALDDLDERRSDHRGERRHRAAVETQRQVADEQRRVDERGVDPAKS